jgi:hypothetical protein
VPRAGRERGNELGGGRRERESGVPRRNLAHPGDELTGVDCAGRRGG